MKSTILALMALASFGAMAQSSPSQSTEQFCADRSQSSFAKDLMQDSDNLMSFRNQGGLANGGVCWWHSRFQRNALYLTIYRPADKKPGADAIKTIVEQIRDGKEIVVIPGYRNFNEFSSENRNVIQRELEKWQKGDGVVKFNWVIGLAGKNKVAASKLKEMMDELYEYVEVEGNIAYQKLQIKGITAHAWLVVNMKKTSAGYDLEILDSNFPSQTSVYNFTEGMTHFTHYGYGEFVPYLERKGEMEKVTQTILKKCDPAEYEKRKGRAKNDDESDS